MTDERQKRRNGTRQRGRRLAAFVCLLFSMSVWAQESNPLADTTPPVIELETLDNVFADQSQVFTVQIAEETELRDATFYYRRSGELPFSATPMSAIGNSGFYSAAIPTDPNDLRAIEYYIQARDISGNRTVSGFAFDPYIRRLSPAQETIEQPVQATQPTADQSGPAISEPFYKKRWVQIAIGVVAVGVIASSIGGDDGTESRVAPVTFSLE